jgi:parallel beta-helix repeat protein
VRGISLLTHLASWKRDETGRHAAWASILFGLLFIGLLNLNIVRSDTLTRAFSQIVVPDQYSTIQEAVNNADDGDIIFVRAGTYYEHVIVGKSLTLLGEGREVTIIDGNLTGNVVTVIQDYVNIRGFTIQRSGRAYTNSGIYVGSAQHCDISTNYIVDNEYGVHGSPKNISIIDNAVEGNFFGVDLQSGATDNVISRNQLVANYVSVHLNLADANYILQNNMTNNYRSVTLWDSKNNMLYHNNFLNNTFGSVNSPNFLDNGLEGNYWSDYDGLDVDGDGIGDTPYEIDINNVDRYPLMNPWIRLLGDINDDRTVDIFDAILLFNAFNSAIGTPTWNPEADLNHDDFVDIFDAILLANHYNQHYP